MKQMECLGSLDRYVKNLSKSSIPTPHLPQEYPWKVLYSLHLDLASYLSEEENALLYQIIRDRDFSAYLLLEDIWGLQAINVLPPNRDLTDQVSAKYQLASLIKKFQFPSSADTRRSAAFEKFKAAEEQCLRFNTNGFQSLCKGSDFIADTLTYARGFLVKLLEDKCPTKEILTRWSRHGPGANLDTSEDSSNYFKYSNWPYSCTRATLPYAQFLIATDKRWLGALEDDYRERYNIPKYRIIDQHKFWQDVFQVVEGNKIAFVPKSAVIDRTIAIEPSMNLVLQLGVDGFIRNRLKRFGIDLDSQILNQKLAYQGSLRDDNESFVTLDLAAASDTISLKLCEMLLPPDWYDYLCKLRSPKGNVAGETFSYEKISSMGCGFTFVLESAIFAALTYAAHRSANFKCVFGENVAIYGDDLIVKKTAAKFVVDTLVLAGFKVNTGKSFFQGPVRESCGADWFMGRDVRPISLKTFPIITPALFVDRNRLKRFLELQFGITKSRTVQMLDNWVPPILRGIRGPYSDESFDSFLHSTVDEVRFSLFSKNFNNKSVIKWTKGYWFFPILTNRAKRYLPTKQLFGRKVNCDTNFLFRKLMHNLSPLERPKEFGKDVKLASSGSRFTVVRSHATTVSATISETSFWSSDYSTTKAYF